ncbi:hypothetical protein ACIA6D_30495 [Streptomyces cacaoi]|uniref:hypothetical protein n=1 Tax=Streptomyces TaxID=1883 RepID=UPI0033E03C95
MKDVAEVGTIWASRTGSYNHNEIVVPVDLDAEVDEGAGTGAVEAGLYPRWGWSNHNEIVIAG